MVEAEGCGGGWGDGGSGGGWGGGLGDGSGGVGRRVGAEVWVVGRAEGPSKETQSIKPTLSWQIMLPSSCMSVSASDIRITLSFC